MGARADAGANASDRESYAKVLANLASVLVALAILAAVVAVEPRAPRPETPPRPPAEIAVVVAPRPSPPRRVAAPAHPAPEPPKLDREAVANAEQALDAASRDRERAEGRADDAAKRLSMTVEQAAAEARAARSLASRVRDPSTRISQAAARGGFLRADRDKLKGQIAAVASIPRPKAKVLSNKNPVARPADGDECHFELRRNRVSWIDLEKLIALVKADAMLRIRLSDNSRTVDSRVGPVGAFSLEYTMARSIAGTFGDMSDRRRISFDLRAWEIVPEFEGRGESYETTLKPISEFGRALNRLNPSKATVTLWVYPDSFVLFRKLREDIQARGFLVAARPLPEGMAIRGSPAGSLSAGQ